MKKYYFSWDKFVKDQFDLNVFVGSIEEEIYKPLNNREVINGLIDNIPIHKDWCIKKRVKGGKNMWIRSQDKEALTNGDIIYYCNKYGMYTEIRCGKAGISDDYDLVLAAYSTKEKASKVLDMIQKFICDYQHGEVFQMPQDDEVEE